MIIKIELNGFNIISLPTFTYSKLTTETAANTFMVELEKIIIRKLKREVKLWRRFVDDTICFAKMDSLNCILLTINSFHKNIKFTIEIEQNSMILFLYVLLLRTPQKIHATVYRKNTNTNLFIDWNSFTPNN